MQLEAIYQRLCNTKSDINEHLPTLKRYAEKCKHITEFGLRFGESTHALLMGKPDKLINYDIQYSVHAISLSGLAKIQNTDFKFINENVLTATIEPTELLFIDTTGAFNQLSTELNNHSNKVSKYIIVHDTVVFGRSHGHEKKGLMDAIDQFLATNLNWEIVESFENNNGLTVLGRKDRDSTNSITSSSGNSIVKTDIKPLIDNHIDENIIIIHMADDMLVFHSVKLLRDVFELIGKKIFIFHITDQKNIDEHLSITNNVIFYRSTYIIDSIKSKYPNMNIGYLIDDNIFYENDPVLGIYPPAPLYRNAIKKADYCLSFSKNLTTELLKLNVNSYCIGNPPLWKGRYDKHNIIEFVKKGNDVLTIGVISKNHFDADSFSVILKAQKQADIPIKVIYFSQDPVKITVPGVTFVHHKVTSYESSDCVKEWYNILHGLNLDMVYMEFPNNLIIAGKSDLKFREAAYMKIPLVAVDPTGKIYTSIINGENGYTVPTKEQAEEVLKELFLNTEKVKELGINAYETLKSRDPKKFAQNVLKIMNKSNMLDRIDYLIIHESDELLYFHNVGLFKDIMELADKKVVSVLVSQKHQLEQLVKRTNNVICYRTTELPAQIKKLNPNIKIGYMIDDFIFYEGHDMLVPMDMRNAIRNCIKTADYCISFSQNLTTELLKLNNNSHFLGNRPLWTDQYEKYDIIEPKYKKSINDYISIGVISGPAHTDRIKNHLLSIIEACKDLNKKIKITYFADRAITINHPENIELEYFNFHQDSIKKWYNALHKLELDFVYVEYPDHIILNGKSDLKFREAAYMGVPIVAVDPSGSIYNEIINGKNGWTVKSTKEAIEIMKEIFISPENIKSIGNEANNTLMSRDPIDMAHKIDLVLKYITEPALQVFKPLIRPEAIISVTETLKSGWIGCGPKTKLFEQNFKKYINTPGECVAVMSCTDALELAVMLYDISIGDQVITTPISFISTNHAILYSRATPIFVDVDKNNGNILPSSIEERITNRTKAIMVVHLGGFAADMESIEAIAKKHSLKIIEDCAHACGGYYWNGKHKGKRIGSSDNICCFSFQSVKNLPCGDGGMLVVPKDMFNRAMRLRWLGIDKDTYSRTSSAGEYLWKYNVPELGIKANQNDIMSAIGLVQLEYIDKDNDRRRQIARFYKDKLSSHPRIKVPNTDIDMSSCHFYPLYIDGRNDLLMHLREHRIYVGVHYQRNDKYGNYVEQQLSGSEYIETHTITLPIHLHLTDNDLNRIVDVINHWK